MERDLATEDISMKMTSTLALAALAFAGTLSFSPNWTEQDGLSIASKADARPRVYIRNGYAWGATYYKQEGLPWYAVRAYYFGGPWSGPGFSYAGWDDYARRNGIGCTPGNPVKGGDGILYVCQ